MKEKALLTLVGKNIKKIRIKNKLTQYQLAEICDMQKASISRIESGKINITMSTLYCIVVALGVDVKDIFTELS